jgi:hypothetical protein
MALNIDTTRAFRRPADKQTLVEAVFNAQPTDENDWLEWKSSLDLATAEGRFTVAKHILGMANRLPDRAVLYAEGCGYVLVGVEPGNLVGLQPIDTAVLDQGLRAYLGSGGPQWSAEFVPFRGASVLMIIVEAPRWGDPIHCLHRDYRNFNAGAIFVRRRASTERADPTEVAALVQRAQPRTERIGLSVAWDGPSEVVPVDLRLDLLDAWLEDERRTLLAPLERHRTLEPKRQALDEAERQRQTDQPQQRSTDGLSVARLKEVEAQASRMKEVLGLRPEDRSPEDYQSEVESYLHEARESAIDQRMLRATELASVKIGLLLVNLTERNFTDVEVEVEIDTPILAARASRIEHPPPFIDLPQRPRLWGTLRPAWSGTIPGVPLPASASKRAGPPAMEIDTGPPCRISWRAGNIRPSSRVILEQVCLFVPPSHAGEAIAATWKATASDAVGVASGSITFRAGADAIQLPSEELLEQRGE